MRRWHRRRERERHRRWLAGLDRFSISALPDWVLTTIGGAFAIALILMLYMAVVLLRDLCGMNLEH